jgi:hypothetical protein
MILILLLIFDFAFLTPKEFEPSDYSENFARQRRPERRLHCVSAYLPRPAAPSRVETTASVSPREAGCLCTQTCHDGMHHTRCDNTYSESDTETITSLP